MLRPCAVVHRYFLFASHVFLSSARQVQSANRMEALVKEEATLAKEWSHADIKLARRTALTLLPLLKMEALGDGTKANLSVTYNETDGQAPPFEVLRPQAKAHVPKLADPSEPAVLLRSRLDVGRKRMRARENRGHDDTSRKEVVPWIKCARKLPSVIPQPLRRGPSLPAAIVLLEHRYRGEGPLERISRIPDGRASGNPPILVAQQVMMFRDNTLAIVRVVLKSPTNCALVHGAVRQGSDGDGEQGEKCSVSCVLRVEAYLPGSSETLTLNVIAPTPVGRSTHTTVDMDGDASTVDGCSNDRGSHTCEKERRVSESKRDRQEVCRSRKERISQLKHVMGAEVERVEVELSGVLSREAALAFAFESARCDGRQSAATQPRSDGTVVDGRSRENNAFSILLVRANMTVPIALIGLGSGSWREQIGEMIGSPAGQELRLVRVRAPRSEFREGN